MKKKSVWRACLGFTLAELIMAITITGIVSGGVYYYAKDAVPTGQDRNAGALAQAINSAQLNYSLRVSNAQSNWTAVYGTSVAAQQAMWALIYSRIPYASATFSSYVPSGYTFTLAASLTTQVGVVGPRGVVTY